MSYPTLLDLADKWTSKGNETKENYDLVEVGFSSWGYGRGEAYDHPPAIYVDWATYSEEDRPEIMQDLLCNSLARIEEYGPPEPRDDGFVPDRGSRIGTAEAIANQTMRDLGDEHTRQNGSPHENCCHVLFAGYYWGAGLAYYHVTFPE